MKVIVIGDVMVDRNVYGTVSRVSPEAPVPVLDVERVEDQPGGAANVANNISALGCPDISCNLVAAVGRDPDGAALGSMFDPHVVAVFFVDSSSPTLVKTRLRSSGMQLGPRIDQGRRVVVDPQAMWVKYISSTSGEVVAVVVSDYAKGTLTPQQIALIIHGCKQAGVTVFIDGKPANIASYDGATVFTPNLREALEIAAMTDVHPGLVMDSQPHEQGMVAASIIAKRYSIENVFVTLGQHGVAHSDYLGSTQHFPGTAVQAADVTGAGDTFLASLVVSRLRRHTLDVAVLAANTAARLAVQRVGTARVTADELSDELIRMRRGNTKLVTAEEAVLLSARCRRREQLVVFTNGCFDLLHPGHLQLLKVAKEAGDLLIVGLNSDDAVRALKGDTRPRIPEAERIQMLSACSYVDAIVVFGEDPTKLIQAVRPDVLVKGQEYVETHVPGADLVARHGGRVLFVPMLPGFSTTGLLNAQ